MGWTRQGRRCALLLAAGWFAIGGSHASAQPYAAEGGPIVTTGDWGGVGLLQTRTARFDPDGQFNIGYSFVNPYKRYTLSLTYFSWLEATFRYTEVRTVLYSDVPEFSGDQRYKDRGADLKFRLLSEGRFRPALAVGFQDLLGTGLFAGEYFVASKRLGDFDISAGVGWGTIGSAGTFTNPFTLISDEFLERKGTGGPGGQVSVFSLFGGPRVGIFGGVEYHTPLQGLSLKLEYDPNNYETGQNAVLVPPSSPLNFGFVFRPYNWFELSFGRERGNTTMLRFTLRTSLNAVGGLPKIDPPPPAVGPRLPIAAFTPTQDLEAAGAPVAANSARQGTPPGALPIGGPPNGSPPVLGATEAVFEVLAAYGATIERFDLQGNEAFVAVTSMAGAPLPLRPLALAALQAMPADLDAVTLDDLAAGAGQERVVRASVGSVGPVGA